MPRSYDACLVDLAAQGVDQERAKRACSAAFWAEHGMFPEEADDQGIEPGGDCTPFAYAVSAELSSRQPDLAGVFSSGVLQEVARLDYYGEEQADESDDRHMVEVLMLAPGTLIDATGKEFTFTADDMLAYRDNFNPLDQPPILLDHTLSAAATVGRLRALRVSTDGKLMGLWEILGEENVKPVRDGRWSRTSGRFMQGKDRASKVVIEGSIVWKGAFDRGYGDRAQILSRKKGSEEMSNPPKAVLAAPPAPVEPPKEAPDVAAILAENEALKAKVAELTAPKVVEPAAPAAPPTAAELAAQQVNADLQARLATLEAERAQEKQIAKLQRNADDFFKLVEAGKSTPAQKDDEMAVLGCIPDELREKYLALRNQGTNAWPTGPRQSVILAKAPGAATADAELDELATLGADMGFAPKKS